MWMVWWRIAINRMWMVWWRIAINRMWMVWWRIAINPMWMVWWRIAINRMWMVWWRIAINPMWMVWWRIAINRMWMVWWRIAINRMWMKEANFILFLHWCQIYRWICETMPWEVIDAWLRVHNRSDSLLHKKLKLNLEDDRNDSHITNVRMHDQSRSSGRRTKWRRHLFNYN